MYILNINLVIYYIKENAAKSKDFDNLTRLTLNLITQAIVQGRKFLDKEHICSEFQCVPRFLKKYLFTLHLPVKCTISSSKILN